MRRSLFHGVLQSHGIAAAAKHFVGNDSETNRTSVDVRVDERTLREVYLAPLEQVVVEGGVWVLIAAYNQVNGHTDLIDRHTGGDEPVQQGGNAAGCGDTDGVAEAQFGVDQRHHPGGDVDDPGE